MRSVYACGVQTTDSLVAQGELLNAQAVAANSLDVVIATARAKVYELEERRGESELRRIGDFVRGLTAIVVGGVAKKYAY